MYISRHVGYLVFFPFDLNLSAGQHVFHVGAVELGELLVELVFNEQALSKCLDYCLLIAVRDIDLFAIETANVVSE